MAIEKNIKINVDTGNAVKETDKLSKSLKDVDVQADKTSKSVDDVAGNGGAIAILDGLTGGLATRFKDAYEATKLFNVSLKGTRAALIATGVGAFVVALGVVVAYWDEISDAIKQTTKNLEVQLEVTKSVQSNLEAQLKTVNKQIELGEKQGKVNEELEKQKVAILKRLQEQNEAEVKILEKQLQRLEATATEVGFWDSIAANVKFSLFGTKGLADEATRLSGERLKQIADLKTQIENAKLSAIDLELTLFNIANPETKAEGDKGIALPKAEGVGGENLDFGRVEARKTINDLLLDEQERLASREIEITNLTVDEQIAIEERLKNAKIAIAQQTLGNLGSLAKEGSALAKGIAASQATINTFQGVTAALSATSVIPDPFGTILKFVNAAAIGVAGFINVKKILSTKPVTTGAPSASGGGAPPAPSFNVVQGTESNQIANSVNKGSAPVKAYVVPSDVSSGQSMDRNIIEGATL